MEERNKRAEKPSREEKWVCPLKVTYSKGRDASEGTASPDVAVQKTDVPDLRSHCTFVVM